MPVALVTGDAAETATVTAGLARRGFAVHEAGPSGGGVLPAGGIDCYVQLPGGSSRTGRGPGREGLAGRLDLLAQAARRLSPLATVLLAVDDTDPSPAARSADLLAALALVVLEEAGRERVRVVVVAAADLTSSGEVVLPDARPAVASSI